MPDFPDAWHGSHGPSRQWRGGLWALDVRDDELADLTFDGRRVLRSIRAVVRDRDWNTASLVVDDVQTTGAALTLAVHSEGYGSDLHGSLRVETNGDTVSITLDLVSRGAFDTNRTGLVVLHPPQLAGSPLVVAHSDGALERTAFPAEISPHQPVFDIGRLSWTDDGLEVAVEFAGDVFEMEDQRNWTDASYKTYSRPLALPFPYPLEDSEHVRQSITVRAVPTAPPASLGDRDRIVLADAGELFPALVLGASTAPDPAPPSHEPVAETLLVELDLAAPNRHAALDRAAASGRPLDVRLVLDPDAPRALAELVGRLSGLPVVRIAAFDPATHVTDAHAAAALRGAVEAAGLEMPVVGGARSHFTELNRERRHLPDDLDGIVFSVTPLFHSLTTEQLLESVAMQRIVAEQAVRLATGVPVHVGPVTLRPRFNNVATEHAPLPDHVDLSHGYGAEFGDADDPRQDAPQLAAWTIASAAALAVPGVASIAYFEEWGPRGALDSRGADRPVAPALRALEALADGRLLRGDSPDGLVWAVGADSPTGRTVLVANLDAEPRDVVVVVDGVEHAASVPALQWRAFHI